MSSAEFGRGFNVGFEEAWLGVAPASSVRYSNSRVCMGVCVCAFAFALDVCVYMYICIHTYTHTPMCSFSRL